MPALRKSFGFTGPIITEALACRLGGSSTVSSTSEPLLLCLGTFFLTFAVLLIFLSPQPIPELHHSINLVFWWIFFSGEGQECFAVFPEVGYSCSNHFLRDSLYSLPCCAICCMEEVGGPGFSSLSTSSIHQCFDWWPYYLTYSGVLIFGIPVESI